MHESSPGLGWSDLQLLRCECVHTRCLQHSEPALLVGDTGTGKTTVCQMLALMRGQRLHIINCNQHTETSDFLGGYRPVRYCPPCRVPSCKSTHPRFLSSVQLFALLSVHTCLSFCLYVIKDRRCSKTPF